MAKGGFCPVSKAGAQGVAEIDPPMTIQKHLLFIPDLEQIGAV